MKNNFANMNKIISMNYEDHIWDLEQKSFFKILKNTRQTIYNLNVSGYNTIQTVLKYYLLLIQYFQIFLVYIYAVATIFLITMQVYIIPHSKKKITKTKALIRKIVSRDRAQQGMSHQYYDITMVEEEQDQMSGEGKGFYFALFIELLIDVHL